MSSSRRYRAGTVHYLEFGDFTPQGSEMVKGRGVIIVSPSRRRNKDLVIVVPMSKKAPKTHKKHTVRIMHDELNGKEGGSWAKCDMPVTVSTSRLHDYRRPKYEGQNHVPTVQITGEELRRVREAMIRAIGAKEVLDRLHQKYHANRAKMTVAQPKHLPKISPGKLAHLGSNAQTRTNRPVRAR